MAEQADILLNIGGIVDIASINKVGQQIRSYLEQYLSKSFESIGLKNFAAGSRAALVGASSGIEVYSALRHITEETKEAQRMFKKMGFFADSNERKTLTSILDALRVAVNVANRQGINNPINQAIATSRAETRQIGKVQGVGYTDWNRRHEIIQAFKDDEARKSAFGDTVRNLFSGMSKDERKRLINDATSAFAIPEKEKTLAVARSIAFGNTVRNLYSGMSGQDRARMIADAKATFGVSSEEQIAAEELAVWEEKRRREELDRAKLVQQGTRWDVKGGFFGSTDYNRRHQITEAFKEDDKRQREAEKQRQREEREAEARRLNRSRYIRSVGLYAAREVAEYGAFALESRWGESVTRNVYDSRRAETERFKEAGKAAGGVIGAVVGGAIGSIIPIVGTTVGAAVGASIGNKLGELSGTYRKTMLESDIKSANQMSQRLMTKSLYGQAYNTFFAQQLTDAGITNGESAMGSLASRAMGMRGRMMLGQVGEEEMLYMSMMPNYYQALMNGVTGPELARIYSSDLNNIGDSSLRYVVGSSIGGQDAYTMANNPYFNRNYSSFVSAASQTERVASRYEYGYAMTRADVARRNLGKITKELTNTAMRGDKDIYSSRYGTIGNPEVYRAMEYADSWFHPKNGVGPGLYGSTYVTVVNIDGEEVARAINKGNNTNEANVGELQSFYVGGF